MARAAPPTEKTDGLDEEPRGEVIRADALQKLWVSYLGKLDEYTSAQTEISRLCSSVRFTLVS